MPTHQPTCAVLTSMAFLRQRSQAPYDYMAHHRQTTGQKHPILYAVASEATRHTGIPSAIARWRARQAGKKIPTRGMGWGCLQGPCRTLLVSRRSLRDGYRGRFPDLRIILLTNAFPAVSRPVACPVGFRPRLQWRVREGVAPSSRQPHLYSENSNSFPRTITSRSACQVLCCRIMIKGPAVKWS